MIITFYKKQCVHIPSPSIANLNEYAIFDDLILEFIFDIKNNTIEIKENKDLQIVEKTLIVDLSYWKLIYLNETLLIYFINDSHYQNSACAYSLNNNFKISCDTKDMIYLNYPLFKEYALYYDVSTRCFSSNCLSYQGNIQYNDLLKEGQVYHFFGIAFLIINDRLFIQENDLLTIQLDKYPQVLLSKTVFDYPLVKQVHHLKQIYQPPCLKQTLPSVANNPIKVTTPLIVTMGPMLIMGIATLASSSLLAYQRYYQGGDLWDSLPSLILPIVLIISTLLFQPLMRYFDNKRRLKEEEHRLEQFNYQFANICKVGYQKYAEFAQYCDHYLPTTLTLIHLFDQNKMHIYNYDASYLSISFGKSTIPTYFEIEQNNQFIENKAIVDQMDAYLNKMQSIYTMMNFCLDHSPRYLIHDIDENIYKNLLIQLVTRYSSEQLKIVFNVNHSFINHHKELLILPHCYHQKQWLINDGLNTISDLIKDYRVIIISSQAILESIQVPVFYLNTVNSFIDGIIEMDESGCCYLKDNHQTIQIDMDDLSGMDCYHHIFKWFNLDNPSQSPNNIFTVNQYYPFNQNTLIQRYQENEYSDQLIAYFALENQQRIAIDISEKGDGPHGLIAGTTGSGKSEVALALLLSLLIQYSPTKIQILIIDFKGSALALALKKFPHFVGSIDNLSLHECKRFIAALKKISSHRQELFKQVSLTSGNVITDIEQYRNFTKSNTNYENMAHILIMIDEFAQVKNLANEFMDEIIQIARIGRSLGIHLLLSTQKPSGVVNDQILTNTRYKICLKVNDRNDSLEVLGCDKAYYLKNPGEFYLQCDKGLIRGCGIYVKDYDDINHQNMYGSIYSLKESIRYIHKSIINETTYLDTITHVLDNLNLEVPPLLNEKAKPKMWNQIHNDQIILGSYDDLILVKEELKMIPSSFSQLLALGNQQFLKNIESIYLNYLSTYKYDYEVVYIGTNPLSGVSLWINLFSTNQVIECLNALIHSKKNVYCIIQDSFNLLEDTNNIVKLIKKCQNYSHIQILLLLNTVSPYTYRQLGHMDEVLIDSSMDLNIKSMFFTSLKSVSMQECDYFYDLKGNWIALNLIEKQNYDFKASNLYLSSNKLSLNETIYARYLYTGEPVTFDQVIITANTKSYLDSIYHAMKSYHYDIGYHLANHHSFTLIPLQTFIENEELKTIHYTIPLIFVGPGVKQQYIFNLQNLNEHDYSQAYLLYKDSIEEIRWFDL